MTITIPALNLPLTENLQIKQVRLYEFIRISHLVKCIQIGREMVLANLSNFFCRVTTFCWFKIFNDQSNLTSFDRESDTTISKMCTNDTKPYPSQKNTCLASSTCGLLCLQSEHTEQLSWQPAVTVIPLISGNAILCLSAFITCQGNRHRNTAKQMWAWHHMMLACRQPCNDNLPLTTSCTYQHCLVVREQNDPAEFGLC